MKDRSLLQTGLNVEINNMGLSLRIYTGWNLKFANPRPLRNTHFDLTLPYLLDCISFIKVFKIKSYCQWSFLFEGESEI